MPRYGEAVKAIQRALPRSGVPDQHRRRARVEFHNGSEMLDKEKYADICFWWFINMLLQRDERGAEQWWDKGLQVYNGTGFKDLAFDGKKFDTYKLGVCLWTARQINYIENGDFRRPGLAKIEDDMWHMQLKPRGGFYTGYNKDYDPVNASTNTETTCLCLMPYTVPPVPTPTPPFLAPALILLIVGAATTGVTALQMIKRYRRRRF